MRYNFWLPLALSLVVSVSCSEFLNGKKKEEEVLKLNNDKFACLDTVPAVIRDLMEKDSPTEDVEKGLECLATSMEYFSVKTVGSYMDRGAYTVNDLRSFFGDYLGNENQFTDQMSLQFMNIKKALFGGSSSSLTKAEMQNLIKFIYAVRTEVRNLRPYWGIILAKTDKAVDEPSIRVANAALKVSLNNLLKETRLPHSDYSFQDFNILIQELERYIQRSPERKTVNLSQWLPLLESAKLTMFGPLLNMSSAGRWQDAITTITELHRFYLIYKYQFNASQMLSRNGVKVADRMVTLVISLLDRSWVVQSGELPFEVTSQLFSRLKKQGLLPDMISEKAIDDTYKSLVQKILERDSSDPKILITGLEKKHIKILKNEYEIWRSTQDFIETMPDSFTYSSLMDQMRHHRLSKPLVFGGTSQDIIQSAWKNWMSHLDQPHPLVYLPTGELLIDTQTKSSPHWSWASLTRLNLMRTLSRALMLGYGQMRTMRVEFEKVSESGMINWYDDFEALGLDIKAFDPRGANAGIRSFFEADHFVYSSNGDDSLNMQETFEMVNVIFSAGLSGVESIQQSLKAAGCNLSDHDVFGNPWNEEACFKKTLRSHFSRFFKNLPGLKKSVALMNDEQWDEFYEALVYFARLDEKQIGRLETADVRTLVVILHYIESMYIKFDSNSDDRLSKSELIAASERFTLFFKKQYKLKGEPDGIIENMLDSIYKTVISRGFACTVLTGKMPAFTSCTYVFSKDVFFKQYSHRLDIIKTLNAFKSSIK